MRELTIHEVARMFGRSLSPMGSRSTCPIRKHKRADKSFSVFQGSEGKPLWKCHSCDPPTNAGDAIKLYAILGGVDNRTAWMELKDQGFAVPGATEESAPRSKPMLRRAVPTIEGRAPEPKLIIPLAPERWAALKSQRIGAVEAFAGHRGLPAEALRDLDVVDMAEDAVGFGYRDPATGKPCRIKARSVEKKSFWIEPRAPRGESGIALSPLYMAHLLEAPRGLLSVVTVVEGEVDALTLLALGIKNVVSLPDGSSSAGAVDLKPLLGKASMVLSAVDSDERGDAASRELYFRSTALALQVARVRWQKDGVLHKDANDALLAGWKREDFLTCLQDAASGLRGYEVTLASA